MLEFEKTNKRSLNELSWKQYSFINGAGGTRSEDTYNCVKRFEVTPKGIQELETFYDYLVSRDPDYVMGTANVEKLDCQ